MIQVMLIWPQYMPGGDMRMRKRSLWRGGRTPKVNLHHEVSPSAARMSRLAIQTPDSAPADARVRLTLVRQRGGFVPNILGVLANAPVALETFQAVSAIQARGLLSEAEREVVQIVAAVSNGSALCVAGHTRIARRELGLPDSLIEALRGTDALEDVRLGTLARFTQSVIEQRGRVSDEELQRFLAAGYSQAHALEVVLGVSLATLCNYAGNLAQAPLNPELAAYA